MQDIVKPTLFLDKDICKANIHEMANKAVENDLKFKPHMKTHQSAVVGEWIRNAGIEAITVSSVSMANYFANHGWKDITIAFPANVRQIRDINDLAAEVSITLLVNSAETVKKLDNKLSQTVNAYIEIDTGSQRSGIPSDQTQKIHKLISTFGKADKLTWSGFYSHPGHSYQARSKSEILDIHHSVLEQFRNLRNKFGETAESFEICMGDTPCCSVGTDFDGIDAMSPGNFVFYDLMQYQIGSCEVSDIAVAVACPIVDRYPDRNELVIYGGAIHFSKEKLNEQSVTHFGRIATKNNGHWQILNQTYLKSLSQEHGIVRCSNEVFGRYQTGDIISILPVHSCLTANLMKEYTLDNGKITSQLK